MKKLLNKFLATRKWNARLHGKYNYTFLSLHQVSNFVLPNLHIWWQFFLKGLPKPFKQIPNPFKRLFNRKRQTVRNVFAWHIMPRDRQNIFIMFITSSLTFVVFNILQINCCRKFWGFFLCYSLTHLESPLEIFPYGAPPFPPGKSYPFHGGGMDIFRNHILHL